MRTSILLTVGSLFLIGSFSLPQPEISKATRAIEDREAKVPEDGPVPIHGKGPDWYKHHHDGQESSASNSTKIKEREAHHEKPDGDSWKKKYANFAPNTNERTNSTNIKERQAPSDGHFTPPDGMSWMEFKKYMKHMKHGGGTSSTSTATTTTDESTSDDTSGGDNSTAVRMVKFKG